MWVASCWKSFLWFRRSRLRKSRYAFQRESKKLPITCDFCPLAMICPVFKGCFDVLWESLRDDYSQESMGVLQNKGGWLGYEEGDDLIRVCVWVWKRFLRVVWILLKKGGFGKIKIATILFTCYK